MEFKTANYFHKLNNQTQKISTDITALDKCLSGGIALRQITELVGKPGSGRTQMCLQLCLNVQIPSSIGGVEGKALYLDTRKSFNPASLQTLALELERRLAPKTCRLKASEMLKNVYYVYCSNSANLVASILNCRKYLAMQPDIKLIVVDSLSFGIRMLENISERTALLMELHDCFRQLMSKHDVAVIITNELGWRKHRRRFILEPVLGQKHTHLLNKRIWLTNNECFIGKTQKTKRYIGKLFE